MTPGIGRLTSAVLAVFMVTSLRCALAEPLHIYAAGSLTGAFTDISRR
jgi:ABC-type molybdate transport system substrate-binding protein